MRSAQGNRRRPHLAGLRGFLLTLVVVATGLPSAADAADTKPQPATSELEAVIVELSEPPAAIGAGPRLRAASSQRARVRQLITGLEGRARSASGLAATTDPIEHEYGVVLNGFGAELMPETISALKASPDVRRIVPDGTVRATLDVSVPLVAAPAAWELLAYRGAGVTIAVIDTGVDYHHPDLGGCLGAGCKVVGGYDFVNRDADPVDDQGHGTHVAATAAGNGRLLGVAPDARILAYKVLGSEGFGTFSDVIAGIERAVDPNGDGNTADHAAIINMSLGGSGDENDPVATAVDNATAAGVLSVIAAGNDGGRFSIGSPGTARTALTVGATDDGDAIAFFSSRGPTPLERLLKPEITAPGVSICAASLPGAFPGTECLDQAHASISGTSMATPHVAGAAAILRGVYPALSPAEIKATLQQSAVDLGLDPTTGGAGRLDVRAAFDVGTILSPAPLNLGVTLADEGSPTRSGTVALRNLDPVAKTYTLSFEGSGIPAGITASVSPPTLIVPGGGSGNVVVTLTVGPGVPANDDPPHVYHGRLVASAPGEREDVLVSVARVARPANDSCESATSIVGTQFGDQLSTVSATSEPDEPASACACEQNAHTVWYAFTADRDGIAEIDTLGSDYDTVLGVFSGTCGTLSPVTCNDDFLGLQSLVSFPVTREETYYVQVSSFCSSPGGNLVLSFAGDGAAAVADPFTEEFASADFDLGQQTLTFTPVGDSYAACATAASVFPSDPAGGTVLALGDDSAAEVVFAGGRTVSLHGESYGSMFVGSNGYVTFGTPDTTYLPILEQHFALPRIAALFADLDPSRGRVSFRQEGDRVSVTYEDVPSFGANDSNSFQIEVFFDGVIRITYLDLDASIGIAGLSRGVGRPSPFVESDFTAAGACSGSASPVPSGGRKLIVRDRQSDPSARRLSVTLAATPAALVPAPGTRADPTLHGATLQIHNPTTGEVDTLPLPAARWQARGNPSGSAGYRYLDRKRSSGPCVKITFGPDRPMKALCRGDQIRFSLDEPRQETVGIALRTGSVDQGVTYCAEFGGRILRDRPASGALDGLFKAKNAPAPAGCGAR